MLSDLPALSFRDRAFLLQIPEHIQDADVVDVCVHFPSAFPFHLVLNVTKTGTGVVSETSGILSNCIPICEHKDAHISLDNAGPWCF